MVFHAPAYSRGPHGNCPVAQQILHPLCVKHCVNLVFNGHNHNYAHWLIEGIHHLTLGGGGTDTYTPTTTSGEGFIFTEETHHFAEFDYTNDEVIVNIYKTTLDDHYSIENFTIKKNYTFCDNDDVTWEDWKTGLGTVRICDGSK